MLFYSIFVVTDKLSLLKCGQHHFLFHCSILHIQVTNQKGEQFNGSQFYIRVLFS